MEETHSLSSLSLSFLFRQGFSVEVWQPTRTVDKTVFELRDPAASASGVLGFKEHAKTTSTENQSPTV